MPTIAIDYSVYLPDPAKAWELSQLTQTDQLPLIQQIWANTIQKEGYRKNSLFF